MFDFFGILSSFQAAWASVVTFLDVLNQLFVLLGVQ